MAYNETVTRLPRFNRSPEIPSLRLTIRDGEILKCLQRHKILRSDHIVALCTGSRQQVLRRLQRLFHHGYLERPRCQIDYYESTWSQNLHRTRFGWQRFRVLTVTTSRQRVQGIIEVCKGLSHGHGLFLFLDTASLARQGDILTIPWQTCKRNVSEALANRPYFSIK